MTGPAASMPATQTDALLSAAAFPGQAGMPGLTIAAGGDGITIVVSRALAPAARITAVTTRAAAIGAPAPACTTIGTWAQISADETIGRHPARVCASIEPGQTAA